jgi:hypothetical protein
VTTFLEFVCETLLGPPDRDRGNGDSSWPCPKCGHESFHTLPDKPEFKHRFRCFREGCLFRGDEHDLLIHFFPRENYGDRLVRLQDLRELFLRGSGGTVAVRPVVAGLTAEEIGVLAEAAGIAKAKKADLVALCYYAFHKVKEADEAHLAGCHDPECRAAVCLQRRGAANGKPKATTRLRG